VATVITNSRQTRPLIVKAQPQPHVSAQIKIYSGLSQLITANKASIQTIVYSLKKALLEPKRIAATAF
jgi:pyruvate kinase